MPGGVALTSLSSPTAFGVPPGITGFFKFHIEVWITLSTGMNSFNLELCSFGLK